MKIKILKLCGYLVVFSMLAGCATTPGSGTKKTASSVVNVIEYISLKLDMGQQSVIKKGNITVTVNPIAPASPKRKICEKRGPEYKDGPLKIFSQCPYNGKSTCFKLYKYPCYTQSKNLYFELFIKNEMAVPLRLKDSVLAFQAGDAQIPIEYYKDTYASFRKSVVLPGMRLPIKLKIPKIKTQNAKIILGLYDIIVAVDSKSSPIKKAQFVYAFNYSLTKETREEAQEIIPMIIKR